MMRCLLTACAVLAAAVSTAHSEEVFRDLSYKDALAAAKKDGKIVLVEVGASWSTACRKLEKTTWADEAVRKFLAEKTVAIKIDGDKEHAFVMDRRIRLYPTMMFFKPDGTEIDRLIGYRDAASFSKDAEDLLAGRGEMARAKERLPDKKYLDPSERMSYADHIPRNRNPEDALVEYLWCFDRGLELSNDFRGVRISFLTSKIASLGFSYPPAREALKVRRDLATEQLADALKAVKAGKIVTLKEGPVYEALADAQAINRDLRQNHRNIDLFDELMEYREITLPLRAMMMRSLYESLIEARRYKAVIDSTPSVLAVVDQEIGDYRLTVKAAAEYGEDDEFVEHMLVAAIDACGLYFEAALGVGDTKMAKEIARKLLDLEESGRTYATLVERAVRAENHKAARSLATQAKRKLSKEEYAKVESAAGKTSKDDKKSKEDKKAAKADTPKAEMVARRDVAAASVRRAIDAAGKGKPIRPADPALNEAVDVVASLNEKLHEPENTLALFDAACKGGESALPLRRMMLKHVLASLVEQRRYEDVVRSTNSVLDEVDRLVSVYEGFRQGILSTSADEESSSDALTQIAQTLGAETMRDGGLFFEVELCTGEQRTAQKIANWLLQVERSGDAFAMLIKHAQRAEKPKMVTWLAETARSQLNATEYNKVSEFIKRIPPGA